MKANIGKKEKASMMLQSLDSLLSSESSVEIQQTTRGATWKIKVYHPDPYKALEQSNDIYERLKAKYGDETMTAAEADA